jgi:broad specificity phosphatase PhoE
MSAVAASATVTRWWWIRHAPVTTDGGRIYGQLDLDADVSDTTVFAALARQLPDGAVWLTSNLKRTRQTAEAIRAAGLAFEVQAREPLFAEQHFGEWQGQNRGDVFRRHGADHGFWLAPADTAAPGGESFADLMRRTVTGIEDWTRRLRGRDIVCVAHGGTIRAAIGHALGLSPARALAFETWNCSVTRLDHIDDGARPAAWRAVHINKPPLPAGGEGVPL